MRGRCGFLGAILFSVLVSTICLARVSILREGVWPDSWPRELDRFKSQTRTIEVAHGIQETVYEMAFDDRDEFEHAWPYILKLKSPGSPLILERSPSTYAVSGTTAQTGVRILYPSGGVLEQPDGTRLSAGPPWPVSVMSQDGELPEYVVAQDGNWAPFDRKEGQGFRYRARVDIVLVTDGETVDLNRIPLPANTPIIDRRFGEGTE